MTEVDTTSSWLSREDLDAARSRLPILYVHAIPVRTDDRGVVTHIGLLLRADSDGGIGHEVVGGRVLYHERIRDALARHIETDLGPVALPRIPLSPQPFTVAEFFPTPGVTPYHDPRQHAVSLAYVVAVMGDCRPQQDALELAWVSPEDAAAMAQRGEMTGGHGVLVRQALAHIGHPV
ncbi:MAG: NUDIX hydrolase family protein [Intrasporangium sp.]|uniref:NUDIX hydrolase family protein n=1 Tax=Intrasporangium sp. TaxID=1925024 RepID=UPI003F7FCCEB